MSTAALHGVAVLVTRPEHQAAPLCRLLESRGAEAMRLPALHIEAAGDRAELRARLRAAADVVIFTSANAVRFGAPLLEPAVTPAIAAIGPATARALGEAGLNASVTATAGFDTEHLLQHPALLGIAGRHVIIVTGMHGRELLQVQLARRGARVTVVEVYKRAPARHSPEAVAVIEARLVAGTIDVITATSADIVIALIHLATQSMRRGFDRVRWVVPGARVAGALRDLGIAAPLLHARSADDHDLVAAIERWRSSESGA